VRAGHVEAPGVDLTLLDIEPEQYRCFNDVISNRTLWFLHHGLFDLPRRPRFDRRFTEAWDASVDVSRQFAGAAARQAAERDIVLVQDYQLALVPTLLREERPDLRIVYFTHIPFCGPNSIRVLPTEMARALCASMASVPSGFHAERWARAYQASAREILGADATIAAPFVAPLGPDAEALADAASTPEARDATAELDELVGDRMLVFRSDRIDPSKNIARGFAAYDAMLEEHAELRERVVFVAKLNASRETLPEYQAYRQEVELAAARVVDRWSTPGWDPLVVDTGDDYARNVAGLCRYDVLVVNPIKDGLNLVAKEGPLLNVRHGVLCLSPDAGAWDELGEAALPMHPFDIEAGAATLHRALTMSGAEREQRAQALRARSSARTPHDWLADQLSRAG
jgi:trehalose 6-phosphate synthase